MMEGNGFGFGKIDSTILRRCRFAQSKTRGREGLRSLEKPTVLYYRFTGLYPSFSTTF